ncbi:MAG: hypothetical protein MRJ68_11695 [Nitrospira sp.]|nr:hypothetical protein [Nitrospira sp.]
MKAEDRKRNVFEENNTGVTYADERAIVVMHVRAKLAVQAANKWDRLHDGSGAVMRQNGRGHRAPPDYLAVKRLSEDQDRL